MTIVNGAGELHSERRKIGGQVGVSKGPHRERSMLLDALAVVRERAWQRQHDAHAPKVGDLAPDFTLVDSNSWQCQKLSSLRGKPVVLVFGSFT